MDEDEALEEEGEPESEPEADDWETMEQKAKEGACARGLRRSQPAAETPPSSPPPPRADDKKRKFANEGDDSGRGRKRVRR